MEYIAVGILVLLFAAMLVVKFIAFIVPHHNDSRYFIMEMQRAESRGEYLYWRRQLRCHRLCLLPFVNSGNAENFYDAVFGRHEKVPKKRD